MTQAKMTFGSDAFKQAAESLSGRTANTNTVTQRMGLGDTSSTPSVNIYTNNAINNASQAERQGYANANEALANNPMFKQTQLNNARNFTEDTRRFKEGLNFKNTADQRANDTDRFRSSTQLEGTKYTADANLAGNKYTADAGVKSTQIGADANKYGADRQLDGVRLQADANRYGADKAAQSSMYGADKGYQASIYAADANLQGNKYVADSNVRSSEIGANAQVDSARIGADASRFNALLSTGTAFFNSSQYRPTFNR